VQQEKVAMTLVNGGTVNMQRAVKKPQKFNIAKLSEKELNQIRQVEDEMGIILIAYNKGE
jgi:hypothetical protein